MAALTVEKIGLGLSGSTYSGMVPAALQTPQAGGDTFRNDGRTFLRLKTSGTGITVTVAAVAGAKCSDGHVHNKAIILAATEERWFGPFETAKHNDANGNAAVSYTAVTGLTVGVYRLSEDGLA